MIIQEFSFGNYRSFKDIQTLNLAAAKITSKHEYIDKQNVIRNEKNPDLGFLKTKAIYGANASGKSNVIMALGSFIRIIKESVKDEDILYLVDAFKLSTETENEPSFFQLIFWLDDVRYRYGFEADEINISAEWLFAKTGERELPYFTRENQKITQIDKTNFSEGNKLLSLFKGETGENDIYRHNSLFLSSIASLGLGKLSKKLIENMTSILLISGLRNDNLINVAGNRLQDFSSKKYILDFLKYGDTGIEDIASQEMTLDDLSEDVDEELRHKFLKEHSKVLFSSRKKYNANLEFVEDVHEPFQLMESEGTVKLLELSPAVFDALKGNRPLIIDEFDARFHPLLTKKIVELFNSEENKGSQLVFVTHDTNLLSADLLRRDQIEFVEKDKYGASHLYSLAQFKGIRNDASFEKDYIQGKYGAIPFLGDFKKLLDSQEDA